MKTPEEVRALTSELGTSVWSLAALGVLFESNLIDHLRREPTTLDELAKDCPSISRDQIKGVLSVARALGVVVVNNDKYSLTEAALPFSNAPMRTAFTGDIRSTMMQAAKFFNTACTGAASKGWDHIDPRVLEAQGDASSVLASMLVRQIIPTIGEDLAARMARPGACFLDAGVGVGAISIALCRLLPELHAIGIDTYEPALAIARKRIDEAKLTDRITLRHAPLEELTDEAIVDLAWLPSFFIPTPGSANIIPRLYRALRKDGWLLVGLDNGSTNPKNAAVWGLIHSLWGGQVLSIQEGESLLKEAGFANVQTIRGPEWAPAMVLGRRS